MTLGQIVLKYGVVKKNFAPVLFIGNLIAIVAVWMQGGHANALIAAGRLAGLLAFYLALWQLLMIGRVNWIEKQWGHDRLSVLHKWNGTIAIGFIALHPVLLAFGRGNITSLIYMEEFLQSLVAYILFLLVVPISFSIIKKKMRYEVWYALHFILYAAIALSFSHQGENGHDLQSQAVYIYWQVLLWLTFANVLWYRFLRPVVFSLRRDFRVVEIKRENHNVTSIYISGNLGAKPGQFVIVRFLAKGFWHESHPFTVSQIAPDLFRLTIKKLGDYTAKINNIPVGTRVIAEGPLGRFTAEAAGDKPTLLIAGGIGITPLRVIFEEMTLRGASPSLIYSAKTDNDFVLKDELDKIGNVSYLTGQLTIEKIQNAVADVLSRFIYLCGPPGMMKHIENSLIGIGVKKEHILYEKFDLG